MASSKNDDTGVANELPRTSRSNPHNMIKPSILGIIPNTTSKKY